MLFKEYTGKLLLGSDYVNDSYRNLVEVELKDGVVVEVDDYSELLKELRGKSKRNPHGMGHQILDPFAVECLELIAGKNLWWL